MTDIDHQAELARAGANIDGRWDAIVHFSKNYPLAVSGIAIVIIFVFMAIFADVIASHDPVQTNSNLSLAAPSAENIMGADMMGRDMFARIVHGSRISLVVGVSSTLLGGIIGVVIGLMSGYLLGWFDLFMQRIIDIMQAL
ncbi:MAG: ABC transporter permease, partial [Rhodospirillaceae bacterium]|nr:ABC transporter permease [Rhodospirillaceae bacterium]